MIQTANLDTETIVASLRQIMPPAALIDVGIGRGIGAMHKWRGWAVPAAWLVDAESAQLVWTETLAATPPGWRIHVATLAETDGQALCYRSSNPAESGLVPTSKLAALWPNLHEEERVERPVTRLDTLLADDGELPQGAGWWLIVDCLPALRILQGATDTLERCSVLWLRTLLQPLPDNEAGSTLEDLQAFLAPLGFRCVQVSEGNHPALGDALFVRDWAQRLQPVIAGLRDTNEQATRQNQDLAQRLAAQEAAAQTNAKERDAKAALVSEALVKIDAASNENTELKSRLAAAEVARQGLSKRAETLQEQLGQLARARDDQAGLAGERAAQLARLTEENAKLSKEHEALSKQYTATLSELDKLGNEHKKSISDFEKLGNECKATADELEKLGTEHKKTVSEIEKVRNEHKNSIIELEKLRNERDATVSKLDLLGDEHKKMVDELEKVRNEYKKSASEREMAGNELKKSVDELKIVGNEYKKALSALDKLGKEHQSLKSDVQAKDTKIADLNERIGVQDQRERQLVEEIVRAEAQIELIKDLLLREGGL